VLQTAVTIHADEQQDLRVTGPKFTTKVPEFFHRWC